MRLPNFFISGTRKCGEIALFRRLDLFRASVAEQFAGENAEHIVRCAGDMANVLYSKINNVPDPRDRPGTS